MLNIKNYGNTKFHILPIDHERRILMYFYATLELTQESSAELLQAFFEEYDLGNSLMIRNDKAVIEIATKDTPVKIGTALGKCKIIAFECGNVSERIKQQLFSPILTEEEKTTTSNPLGMEVPASQAEQSVAEKEPAVQAEQSVTEEEPAIQTEQPAIEEEPAILAKQPVAVEEPTSSRDLNFELTRIAKSCSSFETFVASVATWLELGKWSEFFVNLAKASTQTEKVSWDNIEKAFRANGLPYSQYNKIACGKRVAEKFREYGYSGTLLTLLKLCRTYQNFGFIEDASNTENTPEEQSACTESISKPSTLMPCMPEIPPFEETLKSVDKTLPIYERVKYVLTAMGLEKEDNGTQEEILALADAGVQLLEISFDQIIVRSNIPIDSAKHARMAFATFINNFVQQYDAAHKVKMIDFLKDLQHVIMFADEIKPF